MRDDTRNASPVEEAEKAPETLKFLFTPVDPVRPTEADHPHARKTTFVPEVLQALQDRFGEGVQATALYANEHTVLVGRERIVEVCTYLKEIGFTYLADLAGIDRFTDEDRFEVFYNLVNIEGFKRLRVKIRVDEETPVAPSVTSVYRSANWYEREVYDMFGIRFEGHPDMRRMFMPEDFEYYPLRKEFPMLGVPGSLPLPPQTPEGGLTLDPFAAAHGSRPVRSMDEPAPEAAGDHEHH